MNNRFFRTLVASGVTAIAVGLPAGSAHAAAATRPPFAQAYVGTATGTLRTADHTDVWRVSGLTFRLQNARFARGRWGGTYLVTGGRVTFTSAAKGECRYSTAGGLSLGRLPWLAASISFLQNLRGSGYAFQARVVKPREILVVRQCGEGTDAYTMNDAVTPAGGLWLMTDISERLQPGRRLRGSHTDRSDRGVRTWTWNLAPRP
jgi:hypothetical protein